MKMHVAEPTYGMQIGEREVKVHDPEKCAGRPCPFHAPSDHALRDAPLNIRFDRYALVERLCPHGVGHPDPDSLAYYRTEWHELYERQAMAVHGCDGCC